MHEVMINRPDSSVYNVDGIGSRRFDFEKGFIGSLSIALRSGFWLFAKVEVCFFWWFCFCCFWRILGKQYFGLQHKFNLQVSSAGLLQTWQRAQQAQEIYDYTKCNSALCWSNHPQLGYSWLEKCSIQTPCQTLIAFQVLFNTHCRVG